MGNKPSGVIASKASGKGPAGKRTTTLPTRPSNVKRTAKPSSKPSKPMKQGKLTGLSGVKRKAPTKEKPASRPAPSVEDEIPQEILN